MASASAADSADANPPCRNIQPPGEHDDTPGFRIAQRARAAQVRDYPADRVPMPWQRPQVYAYSVSPPCIVSESQFTGVD